MSRVPVTVEAKFETLVPAVRTSDTLGFSFIFTLTDAAEFRCISSRRVITERNCNIAGVWKGSKC